MNCNPIEKEDSSQCLKFLSHENRLADIRNVLPKRKRAFPSTNMIKNIGAPDHIDIESSAMQILRSVFSLSTFFSLLRFSPHRLFFQTFYLSFFSPSSTAHHMIAGFLTNLRSAENVMSLSFTSKISLKLIPKWQ